MSTRPQPEQYRTRSEYRWARRLWVERHGGSLIGTLAIAVVIGVLSGSAVARSSATASGALTTST
jgi:hypothetical protein